MSRYHKVPPNGHCIVLAGGYRLCARCGKIQCSNETVQVVYRSPSWGIYKHLQGPNCLEKTVSGWRAVELAMDMRATNVPTPREAHAVSIGGFDFPFVSLLDDEHCHAEMATVTISQRDFLPATPRSENEDGELSEKDQRPMRAITSFSARSTAIAAQTKSMVPQGRFRGLSHSFPRDATGKDSEYPLYSQQQLTNGRRVLKFGGQALDEFTYHRLSGPRPEAPNLPFNSASSPEVFDWCHDIPKAPVEHWKRNPKSAPYAL